MPLPPRRDVTVLKAADTMSVSISDVMSALSPREEKVSAHCDGRRREFLCWVRVCGGVVAFAAGKKGQKKNNK
jgi:type VI protein secretion system component VasF